MKTLGLFGVTILAVAGAGWLWLADLPPPQDPRPDRQAGPAPRPAPGPSPTAAAPLPPRFDVARVGARGMLVTAGRASPGAEVALFDSGREIGRARADARGEWVILPTDPLAPGMRELALLARSGGGAPVAAAETVLLLVPEPPATSMATKGATAPGTLALLLPPTTGAAPRPLHDIQPQALSPEAAARIRLGLDLVDYDQAGAMRFAGSAPPGVRLRVYVGGDHAGDAVADPNGRWALRPERQPGIGRHRLRVDQLAAAGSVAARIELPFQRDAIPEEALADGRVIVQPGFSLWRIARRVYGQGLRYTVIYAANTDQIRDPRLIYPGQVFMLPGEASPGGAQVESSRSR